jgi:hypothetical protein
MVRIHRQGSRRNGDAAGRVEAAITQAQYNLRLILAQLEKVGRWIARVRRLVQGQLSPGAGSQEASYGGVDQ